MGGQESMNVPIWITIGFQQQDRQNSQNLNNDTVCRLPVTSAQVFIGTEKNPDSSVILIYGYDDYSRCYHQIQETFKALTKDDLIKPYISDHDFRFSNVRADDVAYILYVFDIHYQKIFTKSQTNKVEIKFHGIVPNDIKRYA